MRTTILAGCALVIIVLAVSATPHRQPVGPQPKPPTPALSIVGETNWGWLVQNADQFTIRGHFLWSATGVIRKDGKIQVVWTYLADGAVGVGVYAKQPDGSYDGVWGLTSDGFRIDNGDIVTDWGRWPQPDSIFLAVSPPQEIFNYEMRRR